MIKGLHTRPRKGYVRSHDRALVHQECYITDVLHPIGS